MRAIAHLVDLLAVEAGDNVTRLETRRFGRALVINRAHKGTTRLVEAKRFSNLGRDFLNEHAKPAFFG